MEQISHQTVRLGKGKHASPTHGACVMELASMLAGEPFSDHPQSVSPAIACFLRAYNDMLNSDRRQDLYEYASRTVGTVASDAVEARRAAHLIEWSDQMWRHGRRWPVLACFSRRRALRDGPSRDPEVAARYAIQAIGRVTDQTHAAVRSLLDELIAIDGFAEKATGNPQTRQESIGAALSLAE